MQRVVVADDDPAIVELLRQTVEPWGYTVIGAADGGSTCFERLFLPERTRCRMRLQPIHGRFSSPSELPARGRQTFEKAGFRA